MTWAQALPGIHSFVNHLANEYEGAPAPEEIAAGLLVTGLGITLIVYPAASAINDNAAGKLNILPACGEEIATGFGITVLGASLTIHGFEKLFDGW